jgi:hypothetical protein
MLKEAAALLGTTTDALRSCASTCRAWPADERRPALTFSHHHAVMALTIEERHRWLARAEREGWRAHTLRDKVQAAVPPRIRRSGRPPSKELVLREPEHADLSTTDAATLLARKVVEAQGRVPALWAKPKTDVEAALQDGLRLLHGILGGDQACSRRALWAIKLSE